MFSVCRSRVDLGFLIDGSGSIRKHFTRVLDFVKTLISFFPISPRQTRVGVVVFSSRPYPIFPFNRYYSKTSVIRAVDRIRYPYGGTRIGRALRFVSRYEFSKVKFASGWSGRLWEKEIKNRESSLIHSCEEEFRLELRFNAQSKNFRMLSTPTAIGISVKQKNISHVF